MVEEIVKGLKESQCEAILADITIDCLALAVPGSGKTRILSHRIAYLIKACGASSYSSLVVTFTKKAVTEILVRIQPLLSNFTDKYEDHPPNLTVGTFHGVGTQLLIMCGEHIDISSGFDICYQQDSRNVVCRLINALKLDGYSTYFLQASMSDALFSKLNDDKEDELRARMPDFIALSAISIQI